MKKKKRNQSPISPSQYKCLYVVKELNERNLYPLSEGVFKILRGIEDNETKDLKDLKTFSTLISLGQSRITHILNKMVEKNLLLNRYDKQTKKLYYEVSGLGYEVLDAVSYPLKKKEKKTHQTIVKII